MEHPDVEGIDRLRRELRPSGRWGRTAQNAQMLFRILSLMVAQIRVLCPKCAKPMDRSAVAKGESVFWCPFCRTVESIPLFRCPGWVAGIMAVLVLKWVGGI